MKKSKSNIVMFKALYRILAAKTEIVAIDYPPRAYKKAIDTILKVLEKHDIQGYDS